MKPRKRKKIESALRKKGFRRNDTHHRYLILHVSGIMTGVKTKLSHGIREYEDNILSQMAKDLKLSNSDFADLLDCPLSAAEYVARLKECGAISL